MYGGVDAKLVAALALGPVAATSDVLRSANAALDADGGLRERVEVGWDDGWQPCCGKALVHLEGNRLLDLALFFPLSGSPVHHPPLASDGERVFLGDVLKAPGVSAYVRPPMPRVWRPTAAPGFGFIERCARGACWSIHGHPATHAKARKAAATRATPRIAATSRMRATRRRRASRCIQWVSQFTGGPPEPRQPSKRLLREPRFRGDHTGA